MCFIVAYCLDDKIDPIEYEHANAIMLATTTVGPIGVAARSEINVPIIAQNAEMTAAHTVTLLKVLNRRIAERAGKIMSAEISKAPIIFIATTMTVAVITDIIVL